MSSSSSVRAAAASLSSPQILNKSPLSLDEAKWVKLEKIDWKDQNGKERKWEVASRKTRGKSGVDGPSSHCPACSLVIR